MTDPRSNQTDSNSPGELELTSAAEELLQRFLNTTRQQILRELSESGEPSRGRRYGVADIRQAIGRISDRQLLTSTERRLGLDAVLAEKSSDRRWFFTSVLTSFAFFALGVLSAIGIDALDLSSFSGAGLAAAGGVVAALISLVATTWLYVADARGRRESREQGYTQRELVRQFGELERTAQQVVAARTGTKEAPLGMSRLLPMLMDLGIWSSTDVDQFRGVLRLRNSLVHEDVLKLPEIEVSLALAEIARLKQRLRSELITQDRET